VSPTIARQSDRAAGVPALVRTRIGVEVYPNSQPRKDREESAAPCGLAARDATHNDEVQKHSVPSRLMHFYAAR
jgi:hypothetical protein